MVVPQHIIASATQLVIARNEAISLASKIASAEKASHYKY
jgi:hypothetical protein